VVLLTHEQLCTVLLLDRRDLVFEACLLLREMLFQSSQRCGGLFVQVAHLGILKLARQLELRFQVANVLLQRGAFALMGFVGLLQGLVFLRCQVA
jgi:hypothetical protein